MILTTALAIAQTGAIVQLSSLDLKKIDQGWGEAHANKSVDNNPLSIGGVKFERGVGTHAVSEFRIRLNGGGSSFSAKVGVDDEVKERGSVEFAVFGDGKRLWKSSEMKGGQAAQSCSVSLNGVKELL